MMKPLSRVIAILLLVTLIASPGMTRALADLMPPSGLQAIHAEAFLGDTGLTTVTVPEGTVSIGSRAFADSSLKDIYLPISLSDIAEDAFQNSPGTVFHVDYFDEAYLYAKERSIPCEVKSALKYAFKGASVENHILFIQFTAEEACTVLYELLDENTGESLYTGKVTMEEGTEDGDLAIILPETVPDHFVLEARMKTEDGHNLTDLYHTIRTTSSFAGFAAQTADDFTDNVTMPLDGDGYAVLKDGARITVGEDRQLAESTYVIADDVAPSPGDVLLLGLDGEDVPVKVASATLNPDGTYTVYEDTDVTISDLYESYYLSTEIGLGDRVPRSSVGLGTVDINGTFGPVTVDISGTARLVVEFIYDAKWFGEDYYEFRAYVETDFSVGIDVMEAWDSEYDMERDDGLNLVLWDGPVYGIKGIAGLNLKVAIPFAVRVEAGLSVSGHYTSKFGVECISGETEKIQSSSFDPEVNGHAGFEATVIGIKVELYAALPKDLLKASVSGEVGVHVSGRLVDLPLSDMTDLSHGLNLGKKIHGCFVCISGDVSLEGGIEFGLSWKVSRHCHGDIVKGQLGWFDIDLFDFYISVLNDQDSLFGGKLTFGKGDCPNCMYRTVIKTVDTAGNTVTQIPVTIRRDGKEADQGESEMTAYLYPGNYVAEASFTSGTCTEGFKITTDEKQVTVKEGILDIQGTVTDSRTHEAIAGAAVSVRDSQGTVVKSAVTGEDGAYSVRIPAGTYDIIFSATGYTGKTVSETLSSSSVIDAALDSNWFTVHFYTEDGSGKVTTTTTRVQGGHTVGHLPSVSRDGYTLAGWNTASDGSGIWFTAETEVTEDITVYAIWSQYRIYMGHSYRIVTQGLSWSAAESWCEAQGGHLVTITSSGEQGFLEQYMDEAAGNWDLWIGTASPWGSWVTGEAIGYSNWGTNEPDGWNNQDCGAICHGEREGTNDCGYYHMRVGQWDDLNGGNPCYFICEWDYVKAD